MFLCMRDRVLDCGVPLNNPYTREKNVVIKGKKKKKLMQISINETVQQGSLLFPRETHACMHYYF